VSMSLILPNVCILLDQLKELKTKLKTAVGVAVLDGLFKRVEERLLKYENRSVSA